MTPLDPSEVLKRAREGPYSVLLVRSECTHDDIRSAYKKLSLVYHPDKCAIPGAAESFIAISDAYTLLSDEKLRATFDDNVRQRQEREVRQRQERQNQDGHHQQEARREPIPASHRAKAGDAATSASPFSQNNQQPDRRRTGTGTAFSSKSSGWVPQATASGTFAEFRARGEAASGGGTSEQSGSTWDTSAWGWSHWKATEGVFDGVRLREALGRFRQELQREQQAVRDVAMLQELQRRGVGEEDTGPALLASRMQSTFGAGGKTSGDSRNLKMMHDGDRMSLIEGGKLKWRFCRSSKSAAPDGGIAVSAISKVVRLKEAENGDSRLGAAFGVSSAGYDIKLKASSHETRESWVVGILDLVQFL